MSTEEIQTTPKPEQVTYTPNMLSTMKGSHFKKFLASLASDEDRQKAVNMRDSAREHQRRDDAPISRGECVRYLTQLHGMIMEIGQSTQKNAFILGLALDHLDKKGVLTKADMDAMIAQERAKQEAAEKAEADKLAPVVEPTPNANPSC